MKFFRNTLFTSLILGIILALSIFNSAQADVNNFVINSFEADYYLEKDGADASRLKVEERIVVQFPDFDQNHGIERAIPDRYQGHSVGLTIESITKEDNTPWNYTIRESNDNKVVRIGDSDRYVRGIQAYVIKYSMRDVINYQDSGDEFYWDVNGDQWSQTALNVLARVHIPADLEKKLNGRVACFTGSYGESNTLACKSDSSSSTDIGKVFTFNSSNLSPGETMTFVVGFSGSVFKESSEIANERQQEKIKQLMIIGLGLGVPAFALLWVLNRWLKHGRDAKGRGVIIPEYTPPKEINVIQSGFLLNENLEPREITASIVNMAIRGYLEIIEVEGSKPKKPEFKLRRLNKNSDLSNVESEILTALFGSEESDREVELKTLSNKLYAKISAWDKEISTSLKDKGYYLNDPRIVRQKYYVIGGSMIVMGLISLPTPLKVFIAPGFIFSGLLIMIFARYMPAKTIQGVILRDYLNGLKEYIGLAEKDRIEFFQSKEGAQRIRVSGDPEKQQNKVKLFEDLLPYAILFKMEKSWAKQFEDIYDQPPSWYRGNATAFNAGYLASGLGSFSNSTNSAFSAPSSSSSSGFGGGGFSGGGGGGGGGGGW